MKYSVFSSCILLCLNGCLLTEDGCFKDHLFTIDLLYAQIHNQQKIQFGIISRRTANIQLSFYSLTEELKAIHPSGGVGTTALNYTTNEGNGEANNYYFIKESNTPWIQVTKDAYRIEGMYSFAVIE